MSRTGHQYKPVKSNRCGATRKVRYESQESALDRGGALLNRGRAKSLRAYVCQFCGGWHLTSMEYNR